VTLARRRDARRPRNHQPEQLRELEHVLIGHGDAGKLHPVERAYVRCRMEDRTIEERSRPCRAGLRPPLPLSPEEEIRGRSGVRIDGVSESLLPRLERCRSATDRQPLRPHDDVEVSRPQRARAVDVANFRRRVWAPAIDSAGIAKPARSYDLRSTFISNALATGLTGVRDGACRRDNVKMIEAHYGRCSIRRTSRRLSGWNPSRWQHSDGESKWRIAV